MAKEKPNSKKEKEDRAKARVVARQRSVRVTVPDGSLRTRVVGPVPRLRSGGVRKVYLRKKTKYAWNTKPRKSKMDGLLKKDEPKGHYKRLSPEKKKNIKSMSFMDLPGELRNQIYPDLIDEIEGRTLVFTNNPTGLVAGWPTTIVPRIPIGLLNAGSKLLRSELLPLAYEKTDIHVRIVSAHLKSSGELFAWVNDDDVIPFSTLDLGLVTRLSLTILLPCSFETIQTGQRIDFGWLTQMSKLRTLRVRVQVHVPDSHGRPWTLLHSEIPESTFTPFVTDTITSLFRHVPRMVKVEFGDGVGKDEDGLGTWVDTRADGRVDQGWMENPRIKEELPESSVLDRDTVAVPCHQAERVWGALRGKQGTADAFVWECSVVVGDKVEWMIGSEADKKRDAVVVGGSGEVGKEAEGDTTALTADEDVVMDGVEHGDTEMQDANSDSGSAPAMQHGREEKKL